MYVCCGSIVDVCTVMAHFECVVGGYKSFAVSSNAIYVLCCGIFCVHIGYMGT